MLCRRGLAVEYYFGRKLIHKLNFKDCLQQQHELKFR